jgi:hypothetical protein
LVHRRVEVTEIDARRGFPSRGRSYVMFVLVRRRDGWWLAAGQNTPVRLGGAVPASA